MASGRLEKSRGPTRSILRGELDRIGLAALLTLLEQEKRGGILLLQRGPQLGRIFLCDGRVLRATCEGGRRLSGREAVVDLLSWGEGRFELWQAEVDGPDEVAATTPFLLMEAARRCDEAAAAQADTTDAL